MVRVRVLLLLAFCAFVVPAPASAQTADEIIAKNLVAKGGVDLLKSTNTVKMTGRIKGQAGEMAMTMWAKRPNLKRNEMEMGGQKMVQAFDGTNAWVMMGTMPPQVMPPGPQLDSIREQSEFDTVFLNHKEQGHKVELVGKTKIEGGEAYYLRIVPKQGPSRHYYLDLETGLERMIVTTAPGPDGMAARLEVRFSDYRSVDGRMMPFSIEQFANGKSIAQTKVDSVEFNVAMDDKLFKMPARQ